MELLLQREPSNSECTFGELYIEGEYLCETIEDPVRHRKIPAITAIPAGRYQIKITHSPKFKRLLPLLLNVPNYEGVRIHIGNWPRDSEGCILPGLDRGKNMVRQSKPAFNKLLIQIGRAIDANQQVWITIKDADPVCGCNPAHSPG